MLASEDGCPPEIKGIHWLSRTSTVFYMVGAGCLFIILSVYFGLIRFPQLLNEDIKSKIALNNGSDGMKAWESLPLPLEFKIYIFNVTNPEEVSQGKQPIVEELGPYVYDQHRKKVDIELDEDDTISYRIEKKFYFNKNKSASHKESDVVVIPNIPIIGITYYLKENFPGGLSFINSSAPLLFPGIKNIFLRVSVGDLLFNGVRIKCDYLQGPAMPICTTIMQSFTAWLTPDSNNFSFSYFQPTNASVSGVYKIYRGNNNIYDLGKIVAYNKHSYLTTWEKNTSCSEIKGTDSTFIPPIESQDDDIYIFLPEVCLSLRAYNQHVTTIYGVEVYHYLATRHNFDSGKSNPSNTCRCKKDKDDPKVSLQCLHDGAIDASKCQGVPFVFTYPHMLFADQEYQTFVKGYQGDYRKHQTEVFIEPRTGAPLAAFKRLQMNIFFRRLKEVDIFANISEGLFPLLWIEEALTEELVQTNLPNLHEMIRITRIRMSITGLLIGIGLFFLLIALVLYLKFRKISCSKDNQVI